jgi:hypothetical protein
LCSRAREHLDVLRQATTTQLLAHLFHGQLTNVIDLAVKVGIDLERQQAAVDEAERSALEAWLAREDANSSRCEPQKCEAVA